MPDVKAPTGPVRGAVTYDGTTGRGLMRYASRGVDTMEHVPELLNHLTAVQRYTEIGSKTHLASLRRAVRLVMESFTVVLDQGDSAEQTWNRVAANLSLRTSIDGPVPDAGGIDWDEAFGLMLDAPIDFGHAYFEMESEVGASPMFPGAMWLKVLEARPQNTLRNTRVNRDGSLIAVEQQGFDDPRSEEIPAHRLAAFVHDPRPGDWWGKPLLRACWEAEHWRNTATRLGMEALDFGGTGVVTSEWVGEGKPGPADYAGRDEALATWKATGGVGSVGWRFNIVSPSGNVDHLAWVKHQEQKMSAAFMASVMELGTTGQGNRALGDTFQELWISGCASLARSVLRQAQKQLVRRLVDWNEGPGAPAPILRLHTGQEVDVLTLPEMAAAVEAGLIERSVELVQATHNRYGLPPASDTLPSVTPTLPPSPGGDVTGAPSKVTAAAQSMRALSKVEAAAKTDFAAIGRRWETETKATATRVDVERRKAGKRLASAAGRLAEAGALQDLSAEPVGVKLLTAAYRAAVDQGAKDALAEANAQGAPQPKVELEAAYAAAEATAAGYASLIGDELAAAVKAQALVSSGQGMEAADIASAVASHVASLSDASVIERTGAGLVASTGEGRMAAMAAVAGAYSGESVTAAASGSGVLARIRKAFRRQSEQVVDVARYYGSSVLDRNSCSRCVSDNGREFKTLAEAQQVYPSGCQNASCEGRGRCRCLVVAVYSDETPADS